MEAITQALASLLTSETSNEVYSTDLDMDDDDISILGSGQEDDEQSWLEEKRESLQTYLDSIPYKCESFEEMQEKLEFIVGRLYIAAKARNWQLLTSWDGLLQWCVGLGVCILLRSNGAQLAAHAISAAQVYTCQACAILLRTLSPSRD